MHKLKNNQSTRKIKQEPERLQSFYDNPQITNKISIRNKTMILSPVI